MGDNELLLSDHYDVVPITAIVGKSGSIGDFGGCTPLMLVIFF